MLDDLTTIVATAVRAFPDKTGKERSALINGLHSYDSDAVLKAMETLLHNGDEDFRYFVMEAVVRFDVSRAAALLLPFVDDPSDRLRYHACGLLGDCADPSATTALLRRAQSDPDVDIRALAIFSLGKIGDASTIPALEAIAATDDAVDSHSFPIPSTVQIAINYIRTGTPYPPE
ncbi:MAG: HEAT repeat domain-containing protein [Anaerolineae bacterium]|nr:HEAT repeat domain-containing protein [Anaerolineae bacterium]